MKRGRIYINKLIETFNALESDKRKMFRQHLLKDPEKRVDENEEIKITSKDIRDWLNTLT